MARYHRYGYRQSWPRSTPRETKGGIKAQSKRGEFVKSWWAKRWITVLEDFNIGARLGRGRSYARSGQVLSIDIEKGSVTAKVQGSRTRPYRVSMKVKTLSGAEWKKLAEAFSGQAIFAARLMAGEMPANIEEAFSGAGLSLFPGKRGDLETDCSCPDWSNPCKHIAAVYYLLGEEFDRDPFLIFRLRGMEREELMGLVGGHAGKSEKAKTRKRENASIDENHDEPPPPPEPLSIDPELFWKGGCREEIKTGNAVIPLVAAALVKRLGGFPFWRGEDRFLPTLEEIYRKASQAGLDAFLGDHGDED